MAYKGSVDCRKANKIVLLLRFNGIKQAGKGTETSMVHGDKL